jgi:hypothetical protein
MLPSLHYGPLLPVSASHFNIPLAVFVDRLDGLLEPDNITGYQRSKMNVRSGSRPISPVRRYRPFAACIEIDPFSPKRT